MSSRAAKGAPKPRRPAIRARISSTKPGVTMNCGTRSTQSRLFWRCPVSEVLALAPQATRNRRVPSGRFGGRGRSKLSHEKTRRPSVESRKGAVPGLRAARSVSLPRSSVGSRTGAMTPQARPICYSPFPLRVPHYPSRKLVSSPRRVKPSERVSRTGLSCSLHAKGYETYRAGLAFGSGRRTRYALNKPSSA